MKASFFALAAAATIVSAQSFPGVPNCAVPCLTSAFSAIGCPLTDVACQCASTAAIQATAGGCILGACTAPGELQSAITGGAALCTGVGTASATLTSTTTVVSTPESTVTPVTTSIPSPTTTPPPAGNSTITRTGGITSTSSRASTTSQIPVGAGVQIGASLGAIGGILALALAL